MRWVYGTKRGVRHTEAPITNTGRDRPNYDSGCEAVMNNFDVPGHDDPAVSEVEPRAYAFIWGANSAAGFQSQLVRKLRDEYGIASVLFRFGGTGGPSSKYFDFDPDDYAEIIDLEHEITPRSVAEIDSLLKLSGQATALERTLGKSLNDILRTDRHYGIGFVTGADFMRSQVGHTTNYAQCLDMLIRLGARFQPLFEKYRPLTVVGSPGHIAPTMLIAMAQSMGVQPRRLVAGRLGKTACWSGDWTSVPLGIADAYERHFRHLSAAAKTDGTELLFHEDTVLPPRPYTAELTLKSFRTRATVRDLAIRLYRISRTELGKRVRGQSMVYGNYLLRDRIKLRLERWWWHRRALREPPVFSELPNDIPYVFFPLTMEPESTLFGEAQSADFQLAHIDMLAKSLPGGWHLIVKEHFAASAPRAPGFWKQVRHYPNVIVAATLENGEAIAARSKAVAGINGSLLLQTARAGHPVITFLADFQGLCMPHVQLVTSYQEACIVLERIRDGELPSRSVARMAGQAFEAANDECVFDIEDAGLLTGYAINSPKTNQSDMTALTQALIESLQQDHGAAMGTETHTSGV